MSRAAPGRPMFVPLQKRRNAADETLLVDDLLVRLAGEVLSTARPLHGRGGRVEARDRRVDETGAGGSSIFANGRLRSFG
jgi:hypothetical protein